MAAWAGWSSRQHRSRLLLAIEHGTGSARKAAPSIACSVHRDELPADAGSSSRCGSGHAVWPAMSSPIDLPSSRSRAPGAQIAPHRHPLPEEGGSHGAHGIARSARPLLLVRKPAPSTARRAFVTRTARDPGGSSGVSWSAEPRYLTISLPTIPASRWPGTEQ